MSKNIDYKLGRLKKILSRMDSCLIAYSGGVDSSLLLKVARHVLKDRVLAVTAASETYPHEELIQAKNMAKALGVRHIVIKTNEYHDPRFKKNPPQRCFYCKKELFFRLRAIAKKNKIRYIIDGSNKDDDYDFRPGDLAKKLFRVNSPLKEAGLGKREIRCLSRRFNLSTWDKPSLACLATRFAYGSPINKVKLKNIDKAERIIRSFGIKQVRVREQGELIRIEVEKRDIPLLIKKYNRSLNNWLKKIGYSFITLDLEGYRSGSMNDAIKRGGSNHGKKNIGFS